MSSATNDQILQELREVKVTLHAHLDEHLREDRVLYNRYTRLADAYEADSATRDELLQGQKDIMSKLEVGRVTMSKMQDELSANTVITSDIRDDRTTINTLRKWLLWAAPVIAGFGAITFGIWQAIQALRGSIPGVQ